MKSLYPLLASLLLAATSAFSQSSTIQVTVNDTIMVPANRISVTVSFKDTVSADPYARYIEQDQEPKEDEPKQGPNLKGASDKVIAILKANKIPWKTTAEQLGGLLGGLANLGPKKESDSPQSISIDFTSKAQMDKVLPQIKAVTFAEATEAGVSVDKELVDKKVLYQKLLQKARAKATEIAGLAGKKVGDIVQIGNAFESFSPEKQLESMMGGGGMFGNLFKMFGGMFNEKSADYKVAVTESMTVTFFMQ